MKIEKMFGSVVMVILMSAMAWGQTTYTWNVASGDWTASGSWSPARSTPAVDDILVFDGSTQASPTVTNIPAQTIGQLRISNSTNLTLQSSAAATLTIGGGTGTDFSVSSGSQVSVTQATNAITIAIATGATGSVSGIFNVSTAAHRLTAADASSLVFASGSSCSLGTGFSGNLFGTTSLN